MTAPTFPEATTTLPPEARDAEPPTMALLDVSRPPEDDDDRRDLPDLTRRRAAALAVAVLLATFAWYGVLLAVDSGY